MQEKEKQTKRNQLCPLLPAPATAGRVLDNPRCGALAWPQSAPLWLYSCSSLLRVLSLPGDWLCPVSEPSGETFPGTGVDGPLFLHFRLFCLFIYSHPFPSAVLKRPRRRRLPLFRIPRFGLCIDALLLIPKRDRLLGALRAPAPTLPAPQATCPLVGHESQSRHPKAKETKARDGRLAAPSGFATCPRSVALLACLSFPLSSPSSTPAAKPHRLGLHRRHSCQTPPLWPTPGLRLFASHFWWWRPATVLVLLCIWRSCTLQRLQRLRQCFHVTNATNAKRWAWPGQPDHLARLATQPALVWRRLVRPMGLAMHASPYDTRQVSLAR